MKRLLTITLIASLLSIGAPLNAQAKPAIPCDGRRVRQIVPRLGYDEVRHRVRDLLLPCAVARFPVSGGLRMARCIADRESAYWPDAKNSQGSGSWGILQIVLPTWLSWWSNYDLVRRWLRRAHPNATDIGGLRLDAYSNVMLGVRAMSDSLSPWGGGC